MGEDSVLFGSVVGGVMGEDSVLYGSPVHPGAGSLSPAPGGMRQAGGAGYYSATSPLRLPPGGRGGSTVTTLAANPLLLPSRADAYFPEATAIVYSPDRCAPNV